MKAIIGPGKLIIKEIRRHKFGESLPLLVKLVESKRFKYKERRKV
jgi:hypothetical protein